MPNNGNYFLPAPLLMFSKLEFWKYCYDGFENCVGEGNEHQTCLCENKTLFVQQANIINNALEKHSHWLKMPWFKFKTRDGKEVNYNAFGLQKQAKMEYLNCD